MSDDRYDERPDRPAWAVVPTMPWSRVPPADRQRDTGTAPTRDRRDPREAEAYERDPRERERQQRERDQRDRDEYERELYERERAARERDRHGRERSDRERPDREDGRDDRRRDHEAYQRDRDHRDRDPRDRDPRERDPRDRDPRDRDPRERDHRDRDPRERERYERERYEREPGRDDRRWDPRDDRGPRDAPPRDPRDRDPRDRDPRDRDREAYEREREAYERDREAYERDRREAAARVEAARVESARAEAARIEVARADAARIEAARIEAARADAARADGHRGEVIRAEVARTESAFDRSRREQEAAYERDRLAAARAETGYDRDQVEVEPVEWPEAVEEGYRPHRTVTVDEVPAIVVTEESTARVTAPPPPPPPEVEITDPESALAAVHLDYDPQTLHEQPENIYELYRIRDSLTAKIDAAADNPSRARLLGLRAVVGRIVGDLRQAQGDAKMALVHAEATGQLRRIAVAQARLANVLVRLGELDEADRLFTQANSPELPDRLRATIHHYAGKCAFEQNRYIEACQHFEKALELRRDGDPELVAATEVALDALFSRVAERGWGPYPRSRDEILQTHKPPAPTFDEQYDRWGFADADGTWPIAPQFADVQPFRDGVAWVRPVGIETWGLIDEAGRLLIDPRQGFLGVGSFSDGLAWVSRDGQGGWDAIDKAGRLLIQGGFDDVRPFRRSIAIVRQRGKWGAVESNGRLAVQFAFDAFSTGLADGRYVEGFTDEGLAIVEVGGRKGVIDRTGRVLVPLAYPTVMIHPVAFLITDANHRWGAITRNGEPLINPIHPSRKSLTDELEALLADTRPML